MSKFKFQLGLLSLNNMLMHITAIGKGHTLSY